MSVSRAETRRRWQERLARFAASDVSVAQFCSEEPVSVAAFYLWRRRLRESLPSLDGHATPAPRFLPIVLSGSSATAASFGSPSLELELPNQIRLRMPRDVEAEFVGRLLVTVAALGSAGLEPSSCLTEVR